MTELLEMKLRKKNFESEIVHAPDMDKVSNQVAIHDVIYDIVRRELYSENRYVKEEEVNHRIQELINECIAPMNPKEIDLMGCMLSEKFGKDIYSGKKFVSHGAIYHLNKLLHNAMKEGYMEFSFGKEFPNIHIEVNSPDKIKNTPESDIPRYKFECLSQIYFDDCSNVEIFYNEYINNDFAYFVDGLINSTVYIKKGIKAFSLERMLNSTIIVDGNIGKVGLAGKEDQMRNTTIIVDNPKSFELIKPKLILYNHGYGNHSDDGKTNNILQYKEGDKVMMEYK